MNRYIAKLDKHLDLEYIIYYGKLIKLPVRIEFPNIVLRAELTDHAGFPKIELWLA